MSIRILLTDDQELVRLGLRLVLAAFDDLEVVGEAADGDEAVDRTRHLKPDVVLMDIRMPRTDGISATRTITEAFPGQGFSSSPRSRRTSTCSARSGRAPPASC